MSVNDRGRVAESREALHDLFGTGQRRVAQLPDLRRLPVSESGFYEMSAAQYHQDPCPEPSLSASIALELVDTTPAHARLKHPRLNSAHVDETAQHFDIGTVAHAALLEGVDVVQILDYHDFKTNAAREARERARLEGKVPLLRKVWSDLELMLGATRRQLQAHEDGQYMFTQGIAEPVLVWKEGGLWFRARIDWLRLDPWQRGFAIDDYKTTSTSADPETLSDRKVWDLGWDLKASFYRRGLHALTGSGAEFRFAVQEIHAPFALSVLSPSPGAEMLGDMKVDIAIRRWQRGLEANDWHAYPRSTAYFEVPAWLEKRWADREVRDGV